MSSLPLPSELKTARLLAGLTQVELAAQSGVSQSVIAKIENNKVDPAYSTVAKLFSTLEKANKGAKLVLVRDVMHRNIETLAPNDSLILASTKMRRLGVSQLPIVNKNKLVGLISENDILNAIENGADKTTLVKIIASPAPPVISSDAPASALQSILRYSQIVCVMDNSKLVGVVTRSDLLTVF